MPRPLPPPAPRLTHDATQFVWGFELPAALLAPPALRAFRCHDCRGIASRAGGKQGLPGARRNRDRWLCFTIIVQNPHPPTISPTRFHTTPSHHDHHSYFALQREMRQCTFQARACHGCPASVTPRRARRDREMAEHARARPVHGAQSPLLGPHETSAVATY